MYDRRTLDLETLHLRHPRQRELLRDRPDWLALEPLDLVGQGILFSRFVPQTGGEQIHLMRPDGSGVQNLSRNPAYVDTCPAWSPDGTRIVFARAANHAAPSQLWTMFADGTGQAPLTVPAAGQWDTEPVWSHTGTIAFTRSYQIWTVRPDGSGAAPAVDYASGSFAIDHMPTWSPDGVEVAFCREFQGFSTIAAVAAGNPAAVVSLVTAPKRGRTDGWPAWSPGGEVIAFWRNDGTSLAIWTIGADGNPLTERAISAPAATQLDYAPCWSPLGDRIAFQRITNVTAHVWVMDADGSNQQDVSVVAHPVGDPSDYFPNWAP